MSIWQNIEDAFTSVGIPPKWKSDAITQLKQADYQQVAPYAVGGGPEPAFVLTHPLYLANSDAENTGAYKQWLIDQNIYKRQGVQGAVDTVKEFITTATPESKQSYITLGVAVVAVFVAWRIAK